MQILPYMVIVPLASAFLIPLVGKKVKALSGLLACLGTLILAITSFAVAYLVSVHKTLSYNIGNWPSPQGIGLVADSLSAFMLITVNIVAVLVAIYSVSYVRKYTDTWKFYSLFMLMLSGINGVLISGDIFNLYVFLEISAISGYFLVAFGTEAEELEAAFKYAVMGTVASAFILLGIAFLYSYTSTLNMADMAGVLSVKGAAKVLPLVSVLFLMGFGLKASLVPFHSWLAYAHSSAPAPISAMLSGVSIKVLGIYALARIFFNIFGMSASVSITLIILAVISMVVGAILAFGQSDIKRLFAYSSVSQIGYIALGLGVATPLSIFGSLFYLFNHSIFKSLLFLNSGTIEHITGTRDIDKIRNIVRESPVTGYTSLAAALSICGVPPLGGFWSKLIIIFACIQAHHPVLALVAVAVSILTLGYYFNALTPVLFGQERQETTWHGIKAVSPAMAFGALALSVLTVLSALMLLPNAANTLLKDAALVLSSGVLK